MEQQYWLGHRERLRLKAVAEGIEALKPREALELILFFAVPRVDMMDLAQALIDRMGGVSDALRASRAELMSVPGMTRPIADWVMVTGELMDAYLKADKGRAMRIWRFKDMIRFLAPRWPYTPAPQTWILYTDYENYMMTYSVVCDSLYWWDPGYIAEIVTEALSMEATHAFLIMFMGVEPLDVEDWEQDCLTSFSYTLRAIGVELLDCVLVGYHGYRSLNLDGYMDVVRSECHAEGLHERYSEGQQARGEWEAAEDDAR